MEVHVAPPVQHALRSCGTSKKMRCQARSVAGVTGKISVQRLRGRSHASAANHTRPSCSAARCPMMTVLDDRPGKTGPRGMPVGVPLATVRH